MDNRAEVQPPNAKDTCLAAIPGLFESGGAIWEDGGERDAIAYCGTSWENVREFDRRVVAYERKLKARRKGAKNG